MIRAFIGVGLPAAVSRALQEVSESLACQWPERSVRWVPAENLHLSLRFLGDTGPDTVPALCAGLDQVASAVAPFQVRLGQVGCFPHRRQPRVLWIELQEEAGQLLPLKGAVDRMLRPLGWGREERQFTPHLTLGRVRSGAALPPGEWGVLPPELDFQVNGMELMESQLTPSGAVYTVLHRALFGRPVPG